ncbi:MAG: L-fucose isomerase [Spirochaetota bacterium]|nr:MAG: L-fucose isomerase [Spirochaetota bacterium]
MKLTEPYNRLQGNMPKIGIRPVIDGRRKGIREALEAQTMGMANALKHFFQKNLRHPNGLSVECVIADTCIGGFAEAARAAEKFEREGVGVSVSVTPCWCYGAETMDMDPLTPKAIWGFNGTERPGAVYLSAVLASHAQKGLPAFSIYGKDVQDADDESIPEDVAQKLLRFAKAGLAVATMKGKSYLAMGGVSMGIAGSIIDPSFLEQWLGMRYEMVDMSEFIRRMEEEIYDPKEYDLALKWVKKYCKEGPDPNKPHYRFSAHKKEDDWKAVVKMALIARDLMIGNPKLSGLGFEEEALGHNAIASGFQGQRQWTDHFPNGDFLETVLNSSFDWNGIREAFVVATENDYLNGIPMLFGHLLSGTSQIFSDVRAFWSPDSIKRVTGYSPKDTLENGVIHLINSGSTTMDGTGKQKRDGKPAMKPFWEITPQEVTRCLEATRFCPADREYFRGGGFSTSFLTIGNMPVTMSRINMVAGLGPVIQVAEGYTVDLPEEVGKAIIDRTNPTWPTTWFVPNLTGHGPFRDVYHVMENWGANHGAISYGHIGGDLISLASMLRIPVSMHNVPSESIFRPKVWGAFGDYDSQGADYRACANFGSLYAK